MEAIKISRSSKLGRYYDFVDVVGDDEIERWESLNLCVFVRRLFLGTAVLIFYGFGLLLAIFGMVYSVCCLMNIYLFSLNNVPLHNIFLYVGIGSWFIFVFFGLPVAIKRIWTVRKKRNEGAFNPFFAWLKAKKEKVCPILEVVD